MPVFQAATSLVSSTVGTSRSWPTHQAGDVALLAVQSVGAEPVTLSTPAGFVEVNNSPQSTGTGLNGTRLTLFWCRATSSSMPTPTTADAGDHVAAVMVTFRGCIGTGDPWDTTAGDVKASASTTLTYPSVTTGQDNCLIVMIGTRDGDFSGAWSGVPSNGNLSGIAERADDGQQANGVGGGIAFYDGGLATAGATGTSAATVSSSINAMMTVALKG